MPNKIIALIREPYQDAVYFKGTKSYKLKIDKRVRQEIVLSYLLLVLVFDSDLKNTNYYGSTGIHAPELKTLWP